jgi:hypothetical protein
LPVKELESPILPKLLLLASPDEYLLELERRDVEAAWRRQHPSGEVIAFEDAPPASRLVQELASPSLFAPERLLVVASAGPYLAPGRQGDAEALARALASLPLSDVTLLLAAVSTTEPSGPFVEAVSARGLMRFLALPDAPKPWEETRVSPAQRRVLASLVERVAPALAGETEVIEALTEVYGFRPRELAQAAGRLLLGGEVSAAEVRARAGAGECPLREMEEALLHRDGARFARFAGGLACGGTLTDWRGDAVPAERTPSVLASTLGRLVRQALAVRGHAARTGISGELQPRRCAGRGWYSQTFKARLYPLLAADVEATSASPLGGLTPWQLHKTFRLAAAYSDAELVSALAELAGSRSERERGPSALAALSTQVLALIDRGAS